MKIITLFSFVSSLVLAKPVSTPIITCESLDANAKFKVLFNSDPANPQGVLESIDFVRVGGEKFTWHKVNGFAQNGFIKIQQVEQIGPFSTLNTTILSGYDPKNPPNKPFLANYRQWLRHVWKPDSATFEYDLSCVSPF